MFEDADLERAAASAPYAVFDNAGQDCCARSRIFVQRSVYDRFLELLVEATRRLKVGDPAAEETEMGPLISAQHRETVASFLDDGISVAFRGEAPVGAAATGSRPRSSRPRTTTGSRARRCSARSRR